MQNCTRVVLVLGHCQNAATQRAAVVLQQEEGARAIFCNLSFVLSLIRACDRESRTGDRTTTQVTFIYRCCLIIAVVVLERFRNLFSNRPETLPCGAFDGLASLREL